MYEIKNNKHLTFLHVPLSSVHLLIQGLLVIMGIQRVTDVLELHNYYMYSNNP